MNHSAAVAFSGSISQANMNTQADLCETSDLAMADVWHQLNLLAVSATAKAALASSLGNACDALTSLRNNANTLLGQTCFTTTLPSGGTGKRTS